MIDLQKTPMSRVRLAYELAPHQADDLVQALCPDAVFPLELWHRAYERFWKDYDRAAAKRYGMECPILPDVALTPGKRFFTDLCGLDVMDFFRKLSRCIESKILKIGLDYILSETFDNFDSVYPEERNFLFTTLRKLEQRGPNYDIFDIENIDDGMLFLPASSYHFISCIFFDTMLVDRSAVILQLRDFPLRHEMKGFTRAFVDSVLSSPPQKVPTAIEEVTSPVGKTAEVRPPKFQDPNAIFVRRSAWAGKTKEAIRDAMRGKGIADEYIVHILLHKRGLHLAKRAIGELLGEPHKSDSAYDKLGKELVEKAMSVNVMDAPEA